MMQRQVELRGDLFVIAEDELGTLAEQLLREVRLDGFEVGDDLTLVEAAALSGAWIIRHKPFPGRNREIGYRFMRLMLREARAPWPRPEEDADPITSMLRSLEAGLISEARFAEWVCLRVATA
ncbi:MAG TPA: hypothetical protein VFK14_03540 [Solirubrobacterales bacterium]|nr:hypothetical protein [Solirubrobacterales bacterium]